MILNIIKIYDPNCNMSLKYYENCIDNLFEVYYKNISCINLNKISNKISKKFKNF